jgi:hypothetical protein
MLGDIRESFGDEAEWVTRPLEDADGTVRQWEERVTDEDNPPAYVHSILSERADEDEYLERLGAVEENEDDTVNIVDVGVTQRRAGARLNAINANDFTANNNITINNGVGHIATFTATEIDHPQIVDHTERLDTLERRYNTLVELAEKQSELISALIGKLGI